MRSGKNATVGIVGCGLIGESWAGMFAAYGLDVLIWDPGLDGKNHVCDRIESIRRQVGSFRDLEGLRTGTVRFCSSLEDAVSFADFIQENAPEQVGLKRELYVRIEAACTQACIIASSTSSLTWSDIAPALARKERFVTAHPFNPPHLIPLVELYGIDPAVTKTAAEFYESLDRAVVVLKKDAAGHIANRLSSALWREAVHIVAEGIADVSDVDRALVNGPGLRWAVMGAHLTYHLGGGAGGIEHYLEHLGPSQERRWATLGNPVLTDDVRRLLIEGVHAEAAGRSIQELEKERDQAIISVLKARETGT